MKSLDNLLIKKKIGMAKRFFITILTLLVLLPLIMFLAWLLMPETKLNVLILDKTVLTTKVQEHISFSWILSHEKYVHSDSGVYKPKKHYQGFFPDDNGNYIVKDFNNFDSTKLVQLANANDMVYYTDLYGIYSNEWIATYYPERVKDPRFISQRSKLYYGGLTKTELELLQIFRQQNKLIINEFNIIAHPTANHIRRAYEKEFDLKWSGWVGRYFDSLDTLTNMDIPRWLIDNYTNQHAGKWPFTKSGIAFVREDDKVEILENETHLNVELPFIYTSDEVAKKYDISKKMKYPFWFDIISVNDSANNVLSEYRIEPNTVGDSLLNVWNIPKKFPALISDKRELYYYLAGDFCDNPVGLNSSKFRGIHWFSFVTASNEKAERVSFFWHYYRPLIKTILKDYNSKHRR